MIDGVTFGLQRRRDSIAKREEALRQLMDRGSTPRSVWLEVKTALTQARQEIAL